MLAAPLLKPSTLTKSKSPISDLTSRVSFRYTMFRRVQEKLKKIFKYCVNTPARTSDKQSIERQHRNRFHEVPEPGLRDSEEGSCFQKDAAPELKAGDIDLPQPLQHKTREEEGKAKQAIREGGCVTFATEETPDDYTDGPTRFVLATDRIKPCASLLFTYDLSQKVKWMLESQKRHARAVQHEVRQSEEIQRFKYQILQEIQSHKNRIESAADPECADLADEKIVEESQQALAALKEMQSNMKYKREEVAAHVAFEAERLLMAVADVTVHFDEACIDALLIGPAEGPEMTVETFQLDAHYCAVVRESEADEQVRGGYTPDPSEYSADGLGQEGEGAIDPSSAVVFAKRRVDRAREHFHQKEYAREQDQVREWQQTQRGAPPRYDSREQFDLHWVQRFQELTHELVEAEEKYCEAKTKATAIREGANEEEQ